jgi:hypothetical protein
MIPDSSMVEQGAVNAKVVGSSPTPGAIGRKITTVIARPICFFSETDLNRRFGGRGTEIKAEFTQLCRVPQEGV